jgi:hypothetical protein
MKDTRIIQHNVIGTRIERDSIRDHDFWMVGKDKYTYGWAYSRATDGDLFDVLRAPFGTELRGDVMSGDFPITGSDGKLESYTKIFFQPHDGQVTREQAIRWSKEHHVRHNGDDKDYYGGIEFVTYKNPKSKYGKLRTDKLNHVSTSAEGRFVSVQRKNGRKPFMYIPIDLVVDKIPFEFDEHGNIVKK